MSAILLLALALAPAPRSGRGDAWVELERGSFHALRPASPADAVVPAWAATRSLSLTPSEGGVLLRATWTLRSLTANAWFSGHVLGDMPGVRVESVRWSGQPAASSVGPQGLTVAGKVSGRAVVEVVAFVPGDPARAGLRLRLMPAARGTVEAAAPAGLVATVQAAEAPVLDVSGRRGAAQAGASRFLGAAEALELSYAAPTAASTSQAAVVVARAGLGLTVGDAELRGRGRLVWELRRGSLSAVSFTAAGTGADLEVTGAGVRAVQRSGEQVRVELQAPVSGRLELDLRWSAPIGKAAESKVALPQIRFDEVFRAESSLQLARDGEVEAVPEVQGWAPSSAAGLPAWGQGLVEGAPTAAFTASAASSGQLDLLRFVAIEGPPVVVDVAAYTIATSREGRALMRAHYEVRNERAASLRVRPPPGFAILGVRVAGETAMIARDRDGAWRVPLPRSVDTVAGLLSFPIEVALLGEAVPWDRRERRQLELPRLDAPVAVNRVTVHLPPGYRSRHRPGDGEVVAAFTRGEGIGYGLGVGAVGAAEADALFQGAVKRWLDNDFGGAQAELDKLRAMGASNENIARLQGNLDLISGRDASKESGAAKQDLGVQRRIREQAKARAVIDQVEQEKLKAQAERSRQSGDYEAAESQYRAALAVGDRLAQLEQRESVEQSTRNEALRSELESTASQAKAQEVIQISGKARKGGRRSRGLLFASKKAGAKSSASGHEFESDDVAGPAPVVAGLPQQAPPADSDGDGLQDRDDVGGDEPVVVDEERPVAAPAEPEAPAPAPAAGEVAPKTPARGTSRDFTAIVEVVPGVARDAAGVRLAGTTSAESKYVVDGANTTPSFDTGTGEVVATRGDSLFARRTGSQRSAPGAVKRQRKVGRVRTRDTLDTKFKPQRASLEKEPRKPTDPPPGMPAPEVTASALSVVVPTVGAAVLYQRLLLPADATYAVDISAREPLISRD